MKSVCNDRGHAICVNCVNSWLHLGFVLAILVFSIQNIA